MAANGLGMAGNGQEWIGNGLGIDRNGSECPNSFFPLGYTSIPTRV